MNTRAISLAPLLTALALTASGCLEVQLNTRVYADGSLERSELVTGDSTEATAFEFLSPVDSMWSVDIRRTGGNAFTRTAKRRFAGAEAFNAALTDSAAGSLPVTAAFERRFLWFYSDITYRERYRRWNPFGVVPLSGFLSAGEIARAMNAEGGDSAHTTSDSAAREMFSRKWTEWMYRDMFEAWYTELLKGVRALGDPRLTPAMLTGRKEKIFARGRDWWASAGARDTLGRIAGAALDTRLVPDAIRANAAGFAIHYLKLSRVGRVIGKLKRVTIEMPGTLVETNAPAVEASRGTWRGVAEMSYAADYELRIASRIVNWWCVALTGLIVLAAVVMLFRSRPVIASEA